MLKTEIICENCDEQFIIVSHESEPEYCPFCLAALAQGEPEEGEE